ncbi:MAG: hypothetical protein B7C24_04390 [Bacteroidetes bacterium 4572_77]|nr:MAG: hypothetical protein B7C24_04390 [Bacteroidetes bacterium 4572_77]
MKKDTNNVINNTLGKLFPPAMRISGLVFMLIGIISMVSKFYTEWDFSHILIFTFLLVLGLFIYITTYGILLDIKQHRYKKYTKIFAYKQGSWESLAPFSQVSVLRSRESTTAFSKSNRAATTSSNLFYDVVLLNKSNRKKLIVKRFKESKLALEAAKDLCQNMGIDYLPYKPKPNRSSI